MSWHGRWWCQIVVVVSGGGVVIIIDGCGLDGFGETKADDTKAKEDGTMKVLVEGG